MASRTFGSGASSLLKSAQSAQNRLNTYNDSLQSYIFELSPKTQADFQAYQKYLSDRLTKETDPSKQLSLQKTQTTAYRSFNSAEIQRASLAVNYGDISKTDKYNQMNGLLNAAIQNGDMSLAQSIENQMSTLSISIQGDAQAAADKAAAAGRAASSGAFSAAQTKINNFENTIDRAFQTGQTVTYEGKPLQLDAPAYAINKAQVLKAKYDLLSSKAAEDPSYADNLSQLQKSADWRGLIDSGLVQFDQNGSPVAAPQLSNLAITYKKDSYGNTYRDYVAPPVTQEGKVQYGLTKPEPGGSGVGYVTQQALSAEPGAARGRVYFPNLPNAQNDQGQNVTLNGQPIKLLQNPGGFSNLTGDPNARGQMNGTTALVDPTTGLRATEYPVGKGKTLTQAQAQSDLQNLVNNPQFKDNPLADIISGSALNPTADINALKAVGGVVNSGLQRTSLKDALLNPGGALLKFGGGVLDSLFKGNQNKILTDEQNARIAAAQAAARAQAQAQLDAFNRTAQAQQQAAAAAAQRAQAIALQKAAGAYRFQPTFNPQPATANPQQTAPAKNLQPTVGGSSLQGGAGSGAKIIATF